MSFIANKLIVHKIIDTDEKNFFEYGIRLILLKTLHVCLIILIGICVNSLFEFILFIILFKFLRESCGGYHARTEMTCTVITLVFVILIPVVIVVMPSNLYIIAFLIGLIIFYMSPQDSKNKPIDTTHKQKLKIRTGKLLILYFFIYIVTSLMSMRNFNIVILYNNIVVLLLLCLSKLEN